MTRTMREEMANCRNWKDAAGALIDGVRSDEIEIREYSENLVTALCEIVDNFGLMPRDKSDRGEKIRVIHGNTS